MPYIAILALFIGFVIWNGSVVLGKPQQDPLRMVKLTRIGDKSAHTATLHLPQMLYIWPYFAFFSVPVIMGPLLRPLVPLLPKQLQTFCNNRLNISSNSKLPTLLVSCLFVAGSLAAVHFNTTIHPYTLADNRHYVFYVFRIIRRHPAIKYIAVPIYYVCAWLVIQALASPPVDEIAVTPKRSGGPRSSKTDRQPCQVSFITIWLATTALSVITAPLVEPRYFIIPWIIWRLHVPYSLASLSHDRPNKRTLYDIRLVLETLWLLAVNAGVSYMFLYRTFTWPSESGNKQRFIW